MKIALDRESADIAPGGEVKVRVTVTNDSRSPLNPLLEISGLDLNDDLPVGLGSIPPGASASTDVTLRLPGDASAGVRRIAVVSSDTSGERSPVSAHVELHTGSVEQVSIGLSPREPRARFRDRMRVQLHNHGNETARLDLRSTGERVSIRIKPSHVVIPPGHSVRARATIYARRPIVRRGRRRPFQITAQGSSAPVTASGTFVQHPLSPGFLFKALAMLVVLAVWAAGVSLGMKRFNPGEKATPVATSVAPDANEPGSDPSAVPAPALDENGEPLPAPPTDASGQPGAPAGGTAAAKPEVAVVKAPAAVVLGTIAGPPDPSGIDVVIERISLGDAPINGSPSKIMASALPQAGGDVLSRQLSRTDEGGRFRFSDGLVVPALYRITASKSGFDIVSQVASLTLEKPNIELALVLVPATGGLSGRVITTDGTPLGDAVVTVRSDNVVYTATTASSGDALGTWSIAGVAAPASYVVTANASGYAAGVTVIELGGGEKRGDVTLTLARGLGTVRGLVTSRSTGIGALTMTAVALDGGAVRTTTTLTDPAFVGRFSFPSLPYGRYSLTLTGTGWLTQTRQIVLENGELVVDIDDARRSTATVSGRVFQEAADSCAYPTDGASGTVTAQACGNVGITVSNDLGAWRTTSATGTGEFAISGVPAGSYTVILERHGYLTIVIPVTLGAGDEVTVSSTPLVMQVPVAGEGGASVRAVVRDAANTGTPLRLACINPIVSVTDSTASVPEVVPNVGGVPPECTGTSQIVTTAETTDVCPIPNGETASMLRACFTAAGGMRIDGLSAGGKLIHVQADGFDDTLSTAQVPVSGVVELGVVLLRPLASLSGLVSSGAQVPVSRARIFASPVDPSQSVPRPGGATIGGWFPCAYELVAGAGEVNGLCVDANADGTYSFGRAFGSGAFKLTAPIGLVDESTVEPPAASLDNEQLSRTINLVAGATETLDLQIRKRGAVFGQIQTPDATGQNFVPLAGVDVVVREPSGAIPTRVTDMTADGQYRVDRLQLLSAANAAYTIEFVKDGYYAEPIVVVGGLNVNSELLKNVVMTNDPVPVAGRVVWRTNPQDTSDIRSVVGANVAVAGTTGYRILDTPPYRESIVNSFPGVTDAGGEFFKPTSPARFVGGTPVIDVTATGFTAPRTTVSLSGTGVNSPANVQIVVEPESRTLNGTIRRLMPANDPTEAALFSRLTVSLKSLNGQILGTSAVSTTGAFSFPSRRPDIRDGAYEITISGAGVTTTVRTATLQPGGNDSEVEFPNVDVPRRGSVTITVPDGTQCSLIGTTESCDVGLAGVTVTLTPSSGAALSKVTCKDPLGPDGVPGCGRGTVTFEDLDLGDYTVSIARSGWFWTHTAGSIAVALNPTTPIVGQTTAKMMRFGRATVTLRGAIESGDPAPVPLASATVALRPSGGSANAASGVTGLDGSVTVEGTLPAGTYDVIVTASGYNPPSPTPVVVIDDGLETPVGELTLIARTASFSGRVIDGGDASVGVVGATVTVDGFPQVVTGTNGTYTVSGLPPRTYTVVYANKVTDPTVTVTRVVNLRPGENLLSVNQTLARATGRLNGTVAGAPSADSSNTITLVGATVRLHPRAPLAGSGGTANDRIATISSSGSFGFDPIEAGDYDLTVSATNYVTDTRIVSIPANAGSFESITLKAAARPVSVTVRSSKTGVSLPVTALEFTRPADPSVKVEANTVSGSATVNLEPGSWRVRTTNATTFADDPHADDPGTNFQLNVGGANPNLTLTLNRYEELSVTLTGRENPFTTPVPLTDATVTAQVGSNVPMTLTHEAGGVYKTRAPLNGSVTITASRTRYTTTASASTTVVADGVTATSLTLSASPRTATITVASTTSGSPALQGVTVTASFVVPSGATGTAPAPVISAPTGTDGTTTLALVPGTWTLTTTDAGAARIGVASSPHEDATFESVLTVNLTGSAPSTSLSLDASNAITGRVQSVFPGGSTTDLSGATVTAVRSGKTVTTTTDSTGAFSLILSPNRQWSVTVAASGHTTTSPLVFTTPTSGGQALTPIDITRTAFALSGKVTLGTLTGTAVNGVDIVYRRFDATTTTTVKTGTTGTYSAPSLDPYSTYVVTVNAMASTVALANRRQPITYLVSPTIGNTTVTLNSVLAASAGSLEVRVLRALQGQTGVALALTGAEATVKLVDKASTPVIDPIMQTTSSTTGQTTILSLPVTSGSGTFSIEVTAPGYGDQTGNDVPAVFNNIAITSSTSATIVNVTLYPLPRDVDVVVTDASGALVTGMDVTLAGGGLGAATFTTATNSSGVASFPAIPVSPSSGGSPYNVTLSKAGYHGGVVGSLFVPVGTSALTAATIPIQLRSVEITVDGDDDGSAPNVSIAGADVTATVAGVAAPTLVSTGSGTFKVEGVLPTGTWSLTATAPGYTNKLGTLAVTGTASYQHTATLTMAPVPTVVTVRSSDGSNLSGVTVRARHSTTSLERSGVTTSGTVSLGLVPGVWTFTTTGATGHDNLTGGSSTLTLPPTSGSPTKLITLEKHEGIRVTLVGRNSAAEPATALSGATVTATPTTGAAVALTEVGTTGVYFYSGTLAATNFVISTDDYTATTANATVTVAADTEVAKSITFTAVPISVPVTVRNSAGTGIGSVQVTATWTGVGSTVAAVTAETSSTGVANLSLSPGPWSITVASGDRPSPYTTASTATTTLSAGGTAPTTLAVALGPNEPTVAVTVMNNLMTPLAVGSVKVTATRSSPAAVVEGTTNATGVRTLVLTPGTWTITVLTADLPSGYVSSTSESVTVAQGDANTTTITINRPQPTAAVTVTPVAASASPGVTVIATRTSGTPGTTATGTTDTDGTVTLTLSPGTWTLAATLPSGYTSQVATPSSITVDVGDTRTVSIALSP